MNPNIFKPQKGLVVGGWKDAIQQFAGLTEELNRIDPELALPYLQELIVMDDDLRRIARSSLSQSATVTILSKVHEVARSKALEVVQLINERHHDARDLVLALDHAGNWEWDYTEQYAPDTHIYCNTCERSCHSNQLVVSRDGWIMHTACYTVVGTTSGDAPDGQRLATVAPDHIKDDSTGREEIELSYDPTDPPNGIYQCRQHHRFTRVGSFTTEIQPFGDTLRCGRCRRSLHLLHRFGR